MKKTRQKLYGPKVSPEQADIKTQEARRILTTLQASPNYVEEFNNFVWRTVPENLRKSGLSKQPPNLHR